MIIKNDNFNVYNYNLNTVLQDIDKYNHHTIDHNIDKYNNFRELVLFFCVYHYIYFHNNKVSKSFI